MSVETDTLLLLKRIADAQRDLFGAITELAGRPIHVEPPVVNVPAPVVNVPAAEPHHMEMPDLRPLLREVVGEVAAASQRSDQILQVLLERFEGLAEKMSSEPKQGRISVGRGSAISAADREILQTIADNTAGGAGDPVKTSTTITASGANTILTPAAGMRIRLYKFGYSADGGNAAGTVASLSFGANAAIDRQWLSPKQPYADGITERWIDGGVDEALIVTLSASVTVGIYVNTLHEEI